MAKVTKKAMAAITTYRDDVRSLANKMANLQWRYEESAGGRSDKTGLLLGKIAPRPINTFAEQLVLRREIEKPELIDRGEGDNRYANMVDSAAQWEKSIWETITAIKKDIKASNDANPFEDEGDVGANDEEAQAIAASERAMEAVHTKSKGEAAAIAAKEPQQAMAHNPAQAALSFEAKEAYLEDMFIFQGIQIQQIYGTAKIVELFARVLTGDEGSL